MAKLLLALLSILLAFSSSFPSAAGCGIAVYWGRNKAEGSLKDACTSGNYKYISIAFLNISGTGNSPSPYLDLSNHCVDPFLTCPYIARHIPFCQKKGIKVLLSLNGGVANYATKKSARKLADHIWDKYLGGWDWIRPLGQIRLDGVDFAVSYGPSDYYQELASALKKRSTKSKKVYLSASPQCGSAGEVLKPAIAAGLFDYVWVQFYNNPRCDYSGGFSKLSASWFTWTYPAPEGTQFFIGLPASTSAAKTGYIKPTTLVETVLPTFRFSNLGGVMLWDRYHDLAYSTTIRGFSCNSTAEPLLLQEVV